MTKKYLDLICLFILLIGINTYAQFGLDPDYGAAGINNINVGCDATYKLGDDKMLVAYKLSPLYGFSLPAIGIRKFNTDGTLDTTFGTNGIGLYTPTNMNDRFDIYAMTVQPDGKIVLAGQTYAIGGFAYYYHFFVFRFNADGTTDTNFGTNGLVKYSMNSTSQFRERFLSVAIDDSSRIVAAGYTEADVDSKADAVAMRFLPNGAFDTGFGTDGVLKLSLPDTDYFNNIDLLADHSILLTGSTTLSTIDRNIIVAKVNEAGTFDATFGTNGIATIDFDLGGDAPTQLFFKPNNKIMIVGSSTINTLSSRVAFAQINGSDGSLDTTFSGDGKNTIYVPVTNHYNMSAAYVALLPDNKYLISSTTKRNDDTSNNYDYAVARINENTTLDTNFASNGVYVNVLPQTHDYARGLHIQSDGKALVMVNTMIYRYLNATVLKTSAIENMAADIIVAPNPFHDDLIIQSNVEIQEIEVFNVEGKKLELPNGNATQMDLSGLANGIYILKIEADHKVTYRKVIKN